MRGSKIEEFFYSDKTLRRHFKGIYAKDLLFSLKLKNKTFVLVNTDNALGTGLHWYLIFRLENSYEMFDSLGLTEQKVKERLGDVDRCYFNESAVQSDTSSSCGSFCKYFAKARVSNFDERFHEAKCYLMLQ